MTCSKGHTRCSGAHMCRSGAYRRRSGAHKRWSARMHLGSPQTLFWSPPAYSEDHNRCPEAMVWTRGSRPQPGKAPVYRETPQFTGKKNSSLGETLWIHVESFMTSLDIHGYSWIFKYRGRSLDSRTSMSLANWPHLLGRQIGQEAFPFDAVLITECQ